MKYTLEQIKRFMASNDVATERTPQEVKRQIDGLDKSMKEFSELQIEVLLGATTPFAEQERYDDEFDEDEKNENGEKWDWQRSSDIYDACTEAEDWLADLEKGDLF